MRNICLLSIMMLLTLLLSGFGQAETNIEGTTVQYSAKGVVMKGYFAYDKNIKGRRPGVLVVHEWWGLNDYARKRARMLAELGYAALAVDMYGEGKQAEHPEDAGKFSSELMKNFGTAKDRFIAAMEFLKAQPMVNPEKIAAIGYCFGGGIVLNMARQGVNLKGVASCHGSLTAVALAERGSVKAKILVLHGADDKFITGEQIEAFKNEMKNAGVDFRFIAYPGARHSFTNPDADEYGKKFNIPVAYNAEADKMSWEELNRFLRQIFNNKNALWDRKSGKQTMVSRNGNVVAARYEGNPPKEKPKVKIFTEHIEDPDWKLPINCFFVDGTGKAESIKIDPESLADTSESIH